MKQKRTHEPPNFPGFLEKTREYIVIKDILPKFKKVFGLAKNRVIGMKKVAIQIQSCITK